MAKHLLDENAHLCIYDPKVPEKQIKSELKLIRETPDEVDQGQLSVRDL